MAQAIRWIRDPRAAAVSPERCIRHGWRLQTFRVWLVRRWPRGIWVRGHPCPPAPPSTPVVVFGETLPVKTHAGSPVHDHVFQSGVRHGTDMGRAGKDARGPGWNRFLQNPTGEGAGAPRGASPSATAKSAFPFSVITRGRMAIGRWPRGTVVRGHPCPPVPPSTPALVFVGTLPVKIHDGSPVHDDASKSGVGHGTGIEPAGKDARGPGWNPVLQNPAGGGAGDPRWASPRTTGFSNLSFSFTTRGRMEIGRWPRTTMVRGHPCPPVPPSTPAVVFGEMPSVKSHAGSPVHDDASHSVVCHGTDMERAGKDARGPGWNPVLKNPTGEGAGAPRGGSPRTTGVSTLPNSVITRGRMEIGRRPYPGSAGALAGPSSRIAECVGPIRSIKTGARELSPCRSPKTPAGEGAGAPRGASPRTTRSSTLPNSVTGNVRAKIGRRPHPRFASRHTPGTSPLPCSVTTTGGAQ